MAKFQAVIFDWAGTMVDFGSFAPMDVFVQAFAEFGVTVTIEEARAPMGAAKWDHIRTMMDMPEIAKRWKSAHGSNPTNEDVDRVYKIFVPMTAKVAAEHATLIPGAKDCIDWLKGQGIKVGSTTGYTREIMDAVMPVAAKQGYSPLNCVCSDDLVEQRPGPLGMYQCFIDLQAYPPSQVIKVDDTTPGIAEGVAAGCVTVGLAMSGNYVGKTVDELANMDRDALDALRQPAAQKLKDAGADYVIDTVEDLPALIKSL